MCCFMTVLAATSLALLPYRPLFCALFLMCSYGRCSLLPTPRTCFLRASSQVPHPKFSNLVARVPLSGPQTPIEGLERSHDCIEFYRNCFSVRFEYCASEGANHRPRCREKQMPQKSAHHQADCSSEWSDFTPPLVRSRDSRGNRGSPGLDARSSVHLLMLQDVYLQNAFQ